MRPLNQIKGFLVDLDGTTYLSGQALPGAIDFFAYLKAQSIPALFFSNNPTKALDEYVKHIQAAGIEATEDQIITSTHATIAHLQSEGLTSVYAVGTPGFIKDLEAAGISISEQDPAAVVVSFDLTLTYEKLKTAALLLHHNPELPYIATNPDLVCPTDQGPIPDCGSIIALLKSATGRTPVVMGKPYGGMVRLASSRLNLKPEQLAVVGDRLYTDMRMGRDHGLTTVLVLSGETTLEDLKTADWQPNYVLENLGSVLKEIQL